MIRILFTVSFLLALPLVTFSQGLEVSQGGRANGRIEGIVVSHEGTPVTGAIVYLFASSGRSPVTTTDSNGGFSFESVRVGDQKVIAFKEGDGFPNVVWSFYTESYSGRGTLLVHVHSYPDVTRAIIELGPKAGRLLIHVIDAVTKQPVTNAGVAMIHKGKPKTLLKSGSNRPDGFDVLIPPDIPIEVSVTAPDYPTWHYEKNGSNSIRLGSGATQEITVALRH